MGNLDFIAADPTQASLARLDSYLRRALELFQESNDILEAHQKRTETLEILTGRLTERTNALTQHAALATRMAWMGAGVAVGWAAGCAVAWWLSRI